MKKYNSVFVDADAFVALNTPQNSNYKKAMDAAFYIEKEQFKVYTCTYVLLEVATVINMFYKKNSGADLVEKISEDPMINLINGDTYLKLGIEKMKTQSSRNVSLN